MVLNVRDVTEQARTEEQLLQSQKLDSIGRLAGGIAHDFNNLLTVILCSVESEGEALDAGKAVAREDIEQIREAGERARDLTRHLLAFARRQAIAPATVDLNAMVCRRASGSCSACSARPFAWRRRPSPLSGRSVATVRRWSRCSSTSR